MKNKGNLLRKYATIVAMSVTSIVFLQTAAFAKGAIIGYMPDYRDKPSDAQLEKITHLMAFSLQPKVDGSLDYTTVPNWLNSTFVNNAHAKGVKVSISVGGGGRSAGFSSATYGSTLGTLGTFVTKY